MQKSSEPMRVIKIQINEKKNLCLWIGRSNIFKMSVLPNLICRFNTIPARYFVDMN